MSTAAPPVLVRSDALHTGAEVLAPGWLLARAGRVDDVGRGSRGPAALPAGCEVVVHPGLVVPGFLDLHAHGALGVDFAGERDPARLRAAVDHHARTGTTSLMATVATVATTSATGTLEALEALSGLTADGTLAGIHLEGPFLSPVRRGAHQASLLRSPCAGQVADLLRAGGGALRVVTLAPELPGALDAVRQLTTPGVVVALGHSDADAATARRAVDAGARLVTHLFNGMAPLHHRRPGLAGLALVDGRLVVEVIADGHHLAEETIDLVLRAAPGRTALVSDATAATGLADGTFAVGGSSVIVSSGVARLADGSSLAGSTTPLGVAALTLARRRRWDADDLVAAAVTAPRRVLGMPAPALGPGEPADLLLLHPEHWNLHAVLRRGQWLAPWS